MSEVSVTINEQTVRVTQKANTIIIRRLQTNTFSSGGSSAGVSSFNSRTGAVVPAVGDYSAFFLTPAQAAALYQLILVSGTNIKSINGNSLLGSGGLTVERIFYRN